MTDPSASNLSSDDISVSTAPAENRHITYAGEAQEYVVKFLFRPKGHNTNTAVAKTHYAVLCSIAEIYPTEVQIFDNFDQAMKEFPTIKSYKAYLHHYKLQFVKANKSKQRSAIYLVFHRIRSTVPLSEIRRHAMIHELLQKVNTRLTIHYWTEDETRIANLGFLILYDPTNTPHDELDEQVRDTIALATKKNKKQIPKFRCSFSSPFFLSGPSGTRTTTKAYDLQCRQQDAKEMISLLQQAYQHNPIFIFHRIRHKNPEVYRAGICRQNAFLAKHRIIPIQGVPPPVMWYLASELRKLPGVLDITTHRLTERSGCWNICTTAEQFKTLTHLVADCLTPLVSMIVTDQQLDLSAMPVEPGLVFKAQAYNKESDGTFHSYVSACSSILSINYDNLAVDADGYEQPPTGSSPTAQAWGPSASTVPLVVNTTTVSDAPSPITQDAFDKVLADHARSTRVVQDLTAQFQQLTASHHQAQSARAQHLPLTTATLNPGSVPPLPAGIYLQQIISATTQSVLAALHAHAHASSPSQFPSSSDAPSSTRPADADMSFDLSNTSNDS